MLARTHEMNIETMINAFTKKKKHEKCLVTPPLTCQLIRPYEIMIVFTDIHIFFERPH